MISWDLLFVLCGCNHMLRGGGVHKKKPEATAEQLTRRRCLSATEWLLGRAGQILRTPRALLCMASNVRTTLPPRSLERRAQGPRTETDTPLNYLIYLSNRVILFGQSVSDYAILSGLVARGAARDRRWVLHLRHGGGEGGGRISHNWRGCLNRKLEIRREPLLYSPSVISSPDVSRLLLNHFRDVTSNTFLGKLFHSLLEVLVKILAG